MPANVWTRLDSQGTQGVAGPAGGTSGTPAPNIITATATVFYQQLGNDQQFGFSGSVDLPTTDPAYSHLKRVDVVAKSPAGDSFLVSMLTTITGTTLMYSGVVGKQPDADESWDVQFIVYNENGAPTPSPLTISSIPVFAAALSGVVGAEVAGARYQDKQMGLHTVIDLTPSISHSQYPLNVAFWVDYGNGVDVYQGRYNFTAPGQFWRIGEANSSANQEAGDIWVPTLSANTTWTVKAFPGPADEQDAVPTGYISSTFTVPAVGACGAGDVSGVSFLNDPVSGLPITYALYNPGGWEWDFYALQCTLPTIAADSAFWIAMATVQKGHTTMGVGTVSGGTNFAKTSGATAFSAVDVGKDIHVSGALTTIATYVNPTSVTLTDTQPNGSGKTFDVWNPSSDYEGQNENPNGLYKGRQFGDFPQLKDISPTQVVTAAIYGASPSNWTIPRDKTLTGATNLDREYRFRIYCISRMGTDSTNPNGAGTYTLQTAGWAGTGDYGSLTPLTQAAALDLSATDPNTITGPVTGGGGNPVTIAALGITSTYLGAASVIATKMAANAITAANGALAALAVVDGNVNDVNVSKLVAGTKIFTGDVFFSRGTGQPIIALSNTGMNLFGQADASTGATGLTSKPYVSIQNSGITVFSGGTGPSVTVTGGGVTCWFVNGSTASPYVLISSGGASLVSGSNQLTISAAGLGVADSGGSYLTATGTTITIAKGSSSVVITSGGVTITNGILTTPVITITSGTLTINLDATNFLKVSDTGTSRNTQVTSQAFICTDTAFGLTSRFGATVLIMGNAGNVDEIAITLSSISFATGSGLVQVLTARQTGPGNPSFSTLSDAQTWCQTLYNALKPGGHGLVT